MKKPRDLNKTRKERDAEHQLRGVHYTGAFECIVMIKHASKRIEQT